MTTRPLAERTNEEVATLVAELRSAAGCPTKRLSRGGHEFVLAKHTLETATEFAETRELLWIAGATRVTTTHIEKLQTSAGAVDASQATVVTVGSGTVEPSLDETLDHLSEDDLRSAMGRTDGMSTQPGRANSGTAVSDMSNSSDATVSIDSKLKANRSAATTESDLSQPEQGHTRSRASRSQSRSLVERVNAPLEVANTWNGTTTARQDTDSRAGHWKQTTHAIDNLSADLISWGALDGSTIECDDIDNEE